METQTKHGCWGREAKTCGGRIEAPAGGFQLQTWSAGEETALSETVEHGGQGSLKFIHQLCSVSNLSCIWHL